MSGRNKLVLLALLVLFSTSALALQASVSIYPKNVGVETLRLYPFEVGELEVSVSNNGSRAIENLNLRVSVDSPLVILRDGAAVPVLSESIALLEPGQTETLFVRVKPQELSQEKQFVYVNYGLEEFTHLAATYVEVAESPLEVQARLAKSALDTGEGSKLVVTLRNKGKSPVNSIEASLMLPPGLVGKSQPLSADFLSQGESIADREFLFEPNPEVTGEKKITLLVSFEDPAGRHFLERDFFVDIQNRRAVLYFIVAAIIALIVVALYIKRRPSKEGKPLEEPQLKELEGKEIKPVPTKGKEIRK
jgi:hypothetical protein